MKHTEQYKASILTYIGEAEVLTNKNGAWQPLSNKSTPLTARKLYLPKHNDALIKILVQETDLASLYRQFQIDNCTYIFSRPAPIDKDFNFYLQIITGRTLLEYLISLICSGRSDEFKLEEQVEK